MTFDFSNPWYEDKRIGKNMIGKILPAMCEVANVPRLTNHSIRPTSIRAMRRGGFERSDIAFISGHKSLDTLANYDSLTVLDRTKLALAIQKGHATLDGDRVDLDQLARGEKRKNDDPIPGPSKSDNPLPSTSKKVTFDEDDVRRAELINDDSGLGASDDFGDMSQHSVVVELPVIQESPAADPSAAPPPGDVHPTVDSDHEPALPSSQAHNIAQLIREQMSTNKELINNYLSALKKK